MRVDCGGSRVAPATLGEWSKKGGHLLGSWSCAQGKESVKFVGVDGLFG